MGSRLLSCQKLLGPIYMTSLATRSARSKRKHWKVNGTQCSTLYLSTGPCIGTRNWINFLLRDNGKVMVVDHKQVRFLRESVVGNPTWTDVVRRLWWGTSRMSDIQIVNHHLFDSGWVDRDQFTMAASVPRGRVRVQWYQHVFLIESLQWLDVGCYPNCALTRYLGVVC